MSLDDAIFHNQYPPLIEQYGEEKIWTYKPSNPCSVQIRPNSVFTLLSPLASIPREGRSQGRVHITSSRTLTSEIYVDSQLTDLQSWDGESFVFCAVDALYFKDFCMSAEYFAHLLNPWRAGPSFFCVRTTSHQLTITVTFFFCNSSRNSAQICTK